MMRRDPHGPATAPQSWPLVVRRRRLAALLAAAAVIGSHASAQQTWRPGRNVELVVGTTPGTGFDRTARVLQAVWKDTHLVEAPVTVVNKPGGASVIGYRYAEQRDRFADELSVIGPLLLTNTITRITTFGRRDLTPLCILLGEEIVVAVAGSSPIKSGRDFVDLLKSDPGSVAVSLSGVGGQNHVTLGLIGQAAGADIGKLKVVGFDGSGEAVTAAAGGHVDAVVGPASSVGGLIVSGRMRGIGVASDVRLGGIYAGIPTWKEQGIPVVFSNWRGMAGPKSMQPAQLAYWNDVFGKTVVQQAWQDELTKSGLTSHYLDSAATNAFLAQQETSLIPVLKGLNLAS